MEDGFSHKSDQAATAFPDFSHNFEVVSSRTRSELIQTIDEVKSYLNTVKKNNGFFPEVSKNSKKLMDQWGNDPETETKPPFFFQGPETAPVYILDSGNQFFKGKSGELLVKILGAMTLAPDQVFICTVDDLKTLDKKIDAGSPKIIITLGAKAGKTVLKKEQPLETFRGRFFEYRGIPVMPTFHPSLLIKDPQYKRQVWDDMKQVMACAGLGQ